ncbi:MAG: class I SAM-dependent methyltransferase [Actinomycetia bacterium]|nr:class I SAM-dependent methyltransferase [Actinomycetes bacterium]
MVPPLSSRQEHWDAVYRGRVPELVTWHQAHPELSLSFIAAAGLGSDAAIVDVGGGSSELVDHLLGQGYTNLTVLDLSSLATGYARRRLGDRAEGVTWLEEDVLEYRFDSTFALWHDRAVFHFLTDPADQQQYVARLTDAVAIGGHVVIATFGLDGPETCSGLPVQRYGREALSEALGGAFGPVDFQNETHVTPTGATQEFSYGHFQRLSHNAD